MAYIGMPKGVGAYRITAAGRTATESTNVRRGFQPIQRRINVGAGFGTPSAESAVAPETSSAMQRAIDYYKEGGGFGKGTEAALARGETKAVASGAQGLVSAGLAGTTMMAGLGKKYQEEVAAPMRARVEETRAQAISSLEMTKAQIIQGATESARASALQKYLATLQSDAAVTASAARQPTLAANQPIINIGQPAGQSAYEDTPYSSIISGGNGGGKIMRSPTAAYGGSMTGKGITFNPLWPGGEDAPKTLAGAHEQFRSSRPEMF